MTPRLGTTGLVKFTQQNRKHTQTTKTLERMRPKIVCTDALWFVGPLCVPSTPSSPTLTPFLTHPHPPPLLWVLAHLAFANEGPGKPASGEKSGMHGGTRVREGREEEGAFGRRGLSAFRWSKKLMTALLCCEKAGRRRSVTGNHSLCQ